jgi:sugar lactone lactonase YvrE
MIKAELVLKADARIGEGSIWDWERNRLLWIDILNGEILSFDPATRENRIVFKSCLPIGTVVQRERGGLVAALLHGIYFVDEETGAAEMICEVETDKPENRFNDGKCDAAGRFWVGTMSGDPSKGSLYRLGTDLKCDKMLEGVSISNGIIWSHDNKTMYYADTPTGVIVAFDYDLETGGIRNKRTVVEIKKGEGGPDGFTIDAEGMLWVAQWGGWQVGRYDPETGKKLETVEVPAGQVSSCAFGGRNLDELYITTARVSLSEEKLAAHPLTGSLFMAKVGVKGVRANKFKG